MVPQSRSWFCWRLRWACPTSHCRRPARCCNRGSRPRAANTFHTGCSRFQTRASLLALRGLPGGHRAVAPDAPPDDLLVRWLRRTAVPAGCGGDWQCAAGTSGGFRRPPMALDRPGHLRLHIVAGDCELSGAAGGRYAISVGGSDDDLSAQLHPVLRSRRLVPAGTVSLVDADRVDRDRLAHCAGRLGGRARVGDPDLLGGAVHLLHVLPRRTGAQQASGAKGTGVLLSHGGGGRRTGRRFRGADRAECFYDFPGVAARELRRRSFWRSTFSSEFVRRGD